MDYEIAMALRHAPEYWATTEELKGLYEVSNLGRLRGIRPRSKRLCGKEGILKTTLTKGYKRVCLRDETNKKFARSIHRLVAEAFLGKSELTVDHINNIPTDNNILNLRYLSRVNNTLRSLEGCYGMKARNRKLNISQVKQIKKLLNSNHYTATQIATQFNVSSSAIKAIKYGTSWKSVA